MFFICSIVVALPNIFLECAILTRLVSSPFAMGTPSRFVSGAGRSPRQRMFKGPLMSLVLDNPRSVVSRAEAFREHADECRRQAEWWLKIADETEENRPQSEAALGG